MPKSSERWAWVSAHPLRRSPAPRRAATAACLANGMAVSPRGLIAGRRRGRVGRAELVQDMAVGSLDAAGGGLTRHQRSAGGSDRGAGAAGGAAAEAHET